MPLPEGIFGIIHLVAIRPLCSLAIVFWFPSVAGLNVHVRNRKFVAKRCVVDSKQLTVATAHYCLHGPSDSQAIALKLIPERLRKVGDVSKLGMPAQKQAVAGKKLVITEHHPTGSDFANDCRVLASCGRTEPVFLPSRISKVFDPTFWIVRSVNG